MLDEHFSEFDPRELKPDGSPPNETEQRWLNSKLRLRPELKTDLRNEHDGLFVVIEDPTRNKFYSVGRREYRFLSSLDGKLTVADVVKNWAAEETLDQETAVTISQWAVQSNLVEGAELDSTARLEKQNQMLGRQKLLAAFNPISIKFKLFNPNQLLNHLTPAFSWFFSRWFIVIWLIIGLWSSSTAWAQWERLGEASVGILSGYRWVWLLLAWALLKMVHEAGHGIACRKYGGDVDEAGVLLLLFTPMAYVNVTSSWRFSNRWHRIVVAGAGMYVELFISFIALIIWSRAPDGVLSDICYNIFFMSSVTTILFNANPLMRFDGYYILADSLGITNLYTKGTKLFTDRMRSWYFGVPQTPNICGHGERHIVFVYGVLAFFWKITVSVGLVLGASVLFYGAGKILGAIGIALFFGLPAWNQWKQLYGPSAVVRPNPKQLAYSVSLTALVLFSLFFLIQSPATKSAAAIVQFKQETLIRAESDGFVEQIMVTDGQGVSKNQLLMVLRNPQCQLDIEQLKHDANAARIQARVHRQNGELALFQAESEKLNGLLEQIAEKQTQVDALRVVAPFDGFVFNRQLDSMTGSFVQRGDTLLNLAEEKSKEIVVAIEQQDWESLKGTKGREMRVAMPSVKVFSAPITQINARATDVATHPSLCANAGGPLLIKNTAVDDGNSESDSEFRLLSPHFNVELQIEDDISEHLRSGQRGRAFFATKRRSLGTYLFVAAEDWLKKKLEVALQSATF